MILKFEDFCKDKSNIYMADLVLEKGDYTEGHNHDFYEFFVVLEGEFIHHYNNESKKVTKGMCQFNRPDTFHRLCMVEGVAHSRLRNIAIEKNHFEKIIGAIYEDLELVFWQPMLLTQGVIDQFQYKTDKIMRFYDQKRSPYIVESIMMDLILHMLYENEENNQEPKWLTEACKKIQDEKELVGGLPRFLELCGKTQEHVTRAFKKHYGITPTEYINTQRLSWSCSLLTTTKQPIIEIAYSCGFNTIAYYNRRFKEKYGCTPTEYRNRNNKTFY